MNNKDRTEMFKKNPKLEKCLIDINNYIDNFELKDVSVLKPHLPQVFIVGAPRSGTTLLFQLLSRTGKFTYPSNLVSRFYSSPAFGMKIQQALLTYDSGNQIFGDLNTNNFNSDLGRTYGALEPNEFWYFWNQYFIFKDIQRLNPIELEKVDSNSIVRKLGEFEAVENKPIVMKLMNLNWHLDYIYKLFPKAIFIHVKREPIYAAQSLIQAREKFFNDRSKWYSFKTPSYHDLIKKPVFHQVVVQIKENHESVEESFKSIPEKNKVTFEYENFIKDPSDFTNHLENKFEDHGYKIDLSELSSKKFDNTNKQKLNDIDWNKLAKSIKNLNI